MIVFAHPAALLLGIVPAALVVWRFREHRRGRGSIDVPGLPITAPSLRARLSRIPAALSLLGLTFAIAALARPQRIEKRAIAGESGADIAVVLDVSGSMSAEDFKPVNRLEAARSIVARFIQGRENDSIALLSFAGKAQTVCPSTTDRETLLELLRSVDGSHLPDGTAIGNAIATAVARLKDLPARSKVIVLVTDGGNNAGQVDPETAADMARAWGIRIHTIGVGRGGIVPITITARDPQTGRTTKQRIQAEADVDEDLLRRIASKSGGKFFRAADSFALAQIFREIDGMEKSPLPPRYELNIRDLSHGPELYSALLLVASLLLSAGPLRLETEAA